MAKAQVLIVGGGIGGLSAALSLAKKGISVAVFEQAGAFSDVGAGIQLSPNCSRILHGLGLSGKLSHAAVRPKSLEVRVWDDGEILESSPLLEDLEASIGFPYYHIHRADLVALLVQAAAIEPLINLHTNAEILHIETSENRVSIATVNRTYEGCVLVGADGLHSRVRSHLFGNQKARYTGHVAWRALVPTVRLKEKPRPVACAWWGAGKHFVHYYVRNKALVNCICVVEKPETDIESWSAQGDVGELKQAFAGWHPTVRSLIENIPAEQCFKWALYDRPVMSKWSKDNIVLLGDACHPTLPFMAQGAAMAIEDGAVLAHYLGQIDFNHRDNVADALNHYQQARQTRTRKLQQGARRNAKIFHLSGTAAWLRNKAMVLNPGMRVMDKVYRYDVLALENLPKF